MFAYILKTYLRLLSTISFKLHELESLYWSECYHSWIAGSTTTLKYPASIIVICALESKSKMKRRPTHSSLISDLKGS